MWTASRGATVDAVLGPDASYDSAGTPSAQHAAKALPGPTSFFFHREGLIGGLPILVLNFPVGGNSTALAAERATDLAGRLAEAVEARDYRAAAELQDALSALQQSSTTPTTGGTSSAAEDDASSLLFWEMSVVPVPNNTGHEQPVFVRFLSVNRSAATGRSSPGTLYFDTCVC